MISGSWSCTDPSEAVDALYLEPTEQLQRGQGAQLPATQDAHRSCSTDTLPDSIKSKS